MSEAYQLPDFLELVFSLTAFVPVNLPTLNMQVLHFICSLFLHFIYLFSILRHTFTLCNRFCAFLYRIYSIYYVATFHHLSVFFIIHFYVFSLTCCHSFL